MNFIKKSKKTLKNKKKIFLKELNSAFLDFYSKKK